MISIIHFHNENRSMVVVCFDIRGILFLLTVLYKLIKCVTM